MTFLNFEQTGRSPSGKTRIISVNDRAGNPLGTVSWYAPWRRYCFDSRPGIVFDAGCLRTIADHLTVYTQEQKAAQVAARGSGEEPK